jgi:hypothetical protein
MAWKSWKAEVIADSTGKWCGNALRFATKEEAEAYVADLAYRWALVTDTRVSESTVPPSHRWENGGAVSTLKDGENNDIP